MVWMNVRSNLLTSSERLELQRAAEAELADLYREVDALHEKMKPLHALLKDLKTVSVKELIAGRSTDDFWTDAAFRDQVVQGSWNDGRGCTLLSNFLNEVFEGLAPEGFYSFSRRLSDDGLTVTQMLPQLSLRYRQDIGPVADALERIYPALADDEGRMRVAILEHTCSAGGVSWRLEMSAPDTAALLRSGYPEMTGDLRAVLTYTAKAHWSSDGPDEHDWND